MSDPSFDELTASVMNHVSTDALRTAVIGFVDIASPTGAERELANWIAARLGQVERLHAHVQGIDGLQANAVARLLGASGGPSVLLYAPLDTFTTGESAIDVPWAGPHLRRDMEPRAVVAGELVRGLGAGNPKGHAACVMVAIEALASSGIELAGDVVAGFGAGGMPAFAVNGIGTPGRANTGHGVGAAFLLERGASTDYAVIAKPGWAVSHEEVGLVWLDVIVPGVHTYVGSRHRLPYRNAVASAGVVAGRLEEWFEAYAGRHEHGTMRPQGIVSSVRGGPEHLAAATAGSVTLRLDVRITTEQTPASVTREVARLLDKWGLELGVELGVVQVAAIPASHTDPSMPIIRAAVRAFEAVSGAPHEPILASSGATDANILRMRGIPTARVGMPKVLETDAGEPVDFTLGMNIVDLSEARRLVEILIRTVLLMQTDDPGH